MANMAGRSGAQAFIRGESVFIRVGDARGRRHPHSFEEQTQ
jgi:hypothetical protein